MEQGARDALRRIVATGTAIANCFFATSAAVPITHFPEARYYTRSRGIHWLGGTVLVASTGVYWYSYWLVGQTKILAGRSDWGQEHGTVKREGRKEGRKVLGRELPTKK